MTERMILSPNPAPAHYRWSRAVLMVLAFLLAFAAVAQAGERSTKRTFTDEELATLPAPGPNPFLSYLPADAKVDWDYWRAKADYDARMRAERMELERGDQLTKGLGVTDTEPNDSLAGAQMIAGFGSGMGDSLSADITGTIAAPASPSPFTPASEDNGAIGSASPTGLTSGNAVTANDTIGDGPHGSSGTGNADFDFFSISGVTAGQSISIRVDTADPGDDLDPNCAIWDSSGTLLGFNEDISVGGGNFDCSVSIAAPSAGTYYLSIGGWKSGGTSAVLPGDPFDSSSGTGTASEGPYTVTIGLDANDRDCFGIDLVPGDILGTNSSGLLTGVEVYDPVGELQMGSAADNSFIYPAASPMPSGGIVTNFVAHSTGTHVVCGAGSPGSYTLGLRLFRQVLEGTNNEQILFVDFDGATIDTSIFGGPGVRTLSPLSSFLSGWGLAPGDESAVIDAILASLEETITEDLALLSNPNFSVEIRNSRDHADPFGQPNVSRLIVGGTIAESGISTIGIAESIDPGNFETEESALILLDLLSEPGGGPNTLNQFGLGGGATQIELVGTGVGNITAHEAGHFLGNWHTEQFAASSDPSIMDQGGNLGNSVGVGDDGDFGTGDDVDVDFSADAFVSSEGYLGTEDTGENTAHGLTGSSVLFTDSFESGNTMAWSSSAP